MPRPHGLKQQIVYRCVGLRQLVTDAPRPAILLQAATVVLHRGTIRLEPIFAEGHLLLRTGLGIDHPKVAVARGLQFLRGKNLHGMHLRAAAGQRLEAVLVPSGIQKSLSTTITPCARCFIAPSRSA